MLRRPTPSTTTDPNRWTALVVLCAGMLMIILDQTIVNVALPSIQSDLGFSQSGLAWVVNAYLIAFGDAPQSRDADVNTASPARKTRLRPTRSPSLPASNSSPPKAMR